MALKIINMYKSRKFNVENSKRKDDRNPENKERDMKILTEMQNMHKLEKTWTLDNMILFNARFNCVELDRSLLRYLKMTQELYKLYTVTHTLLTNKVNKL